MISIVGIFLSGLICLIFGENPLKAAEIIWTGALGSSYDRGILISYTAPLILTGLAVFIPLRMGLFNIGAEGQMLVGSLAAAVFGLTFPDVLFPFSILGAILAALMGGAAWGFLVGWLKAYRGGHEVITSIMLNYVAFGLTNWIVLSFFKSTITQNPETNPLGNNYRFVHFPWFEGAAVNGWTIVCFLIPLGVYLANRFTLWMFEIRAVGLNSEASVRAGIPVAKRQIQAFLLGGGFAGLVGVHQVLGSSGKFQIGEGQGIGFLGIPVALMAMKNPLSIIPSALLFAFLSHGTSALDIESEIITRDLGVVLQALVILLVTLKIPTSKFMKRTAHGNS